MGSTKKINGITHVWSIMDNAWVTLDYWEYINGRKSDQYDDLDWDNGEDIDVDFR